MPDITVEERSGSPTYEVNSAGLATSGEVLYIIDGTTSEDSATTSLLGASPTTFKGMLRRTARVEPTDRSDIWYGEVRYSRSDRSPEPQVGESTYSFDTGGGTQHITQSLQTVARYPGVVGPDNPGAPNFGGAIGVTHNSVDGVDITVPVFQFSETHYIPLANVNDTYKGTLFRLTGKVNDNVFKGYQPGECLFLGASGSQRGTEDYEITFKFACSPNAIGLTVGDIAGINKRGWEYMWIRYEDEVNETVVVKKPTGVYIEKVYDEADFGQLNIS